MSKFVLKIYCNNELIKNMCLDKSVEHMLHKRVRWSAVSCQNFNPCQNHGKCIPNMSDFQCQCPDEFTGSTCEVKSGKQDYINAEI